MSKNQEKMIDELEKAATNFVDKVQDNQKPLSINLKEDEFEEYIDKILESRLTFKQLRDMNIILGDYIRVDELDTIFKAIIKVVTTKREQCQLGYSKAVAHDIANMRSQIEKLKYIVKTYCPQDALVDEMFRCF